ncbi:MFS transporter [Bradyrhizobium jicamae]|uniref:MFS transporter n=1 Tax=Bradyrhizobium jicamae TaxID=280332 RepID=A0ABS5FI96_9BRAD|nr:citrate-proton symporter [Bradyrhizobium jicamae]MBR0796482.1 MFS transporter [Bradyrhizobium jicamae]MBR0937480.1 MFS transporter [Bradyrhizobium jicamae]
MQTTNRSAIVAAIAGNAMEWYDFTIFALMTPVIKSLFFPIDPNIAGSEINALLLTTALFGAGFVMRPIGGLVLGYYGDRRGRKAAMTLGMGLMALAVAMLSLTPTYATVGAAAPLIVLVARLLQGFSVGGEFGTSTAYLIEAAPPGRTGYYGSWQITGQLMANALGATLGAGLTLTFTPEQLTAGAWRIPFLVGLAIIPILLVMRARLVEPDALRKDKAAAPTTKFTDDLRRPGRNYLIGMGMVVASAVSFYVTFGYTVTYAKEVLKLPLMQSFLVQMIAALVMVIVVPIAGAISDRYPRKPLLLVSLIGYFVSLYPLYSWVIAEPSIMKLLVCQVVIAFFGAFFLGVYCTTLVELFPVRIRSTSLSIVNNVAVLISGGFAQFFVTWLIALTASPLAPIFYVMIGVGLGLISVIAMRPADMKPR